MVGVTRVTLMASVAGMISVGHVRSSCPVGIMPRVIAMLTGSSMDSFAAHFGVVGSGMMLAVVVGVSKGGFIGRSLTCCLVVPGMQPRGLLWGHAAFRIIGAGRLGLVLLVRGGHGLKHLCQWSVWAGTKRTGGESRWELTPAGREPVSRFS